MSTVVVVLSDLNYIEKANETVKEIRNPKRGDWKKDIVFISVDFDLDPSFIEKYFIIEKKFPRVDISELQKKLLNKGYSNSDGREFDKTVQWEKIHVFDEYFKSWDKIIYFDVRFSIYDKIEYLEDVDCKNAFVAPNNSGYDDRGNKENKNFWDIIEKENYKEDVKLLFGQFGDIENEINKNYFCNCMFVFDTQILNKINKTEIIEYINKYPIWRGNEMSIMNFFIITKYNIYKELPSRNKNNKYLFIWCEYDLQNTTFYDYCYVKYSYNSKFSYNENIIDF
jgi:hypothetical protein